MSTIRFIQGPREVSLRSVQSLFRHANAIRVAHGQGVSTLAAGTGAAVGAAVPAVAVGHALHGADAIDAVRRGPRTGPAAGSAAIVATLPVFAVRTAGPAFAYALGVACLLRQADTAQLVTAVGTAVPAFAIRDAVDGASAIDAVGRSAGANAALAVTAIVSALLGVAIGNAGAALADTLGATGLISQALTTRGSTPVVTALLAVTVRLAVHRTRTVDAVRRHAWTVSTVAIAPVVAALLAFTVRNAGSAPANTLGATGLISQALTARASTTVVTTLFLGAIRDARRFADSLLTQLIAGTCSAVSFAAIVPTRLPFTLGHASCLLQAPAVRTAELAFLVYAPGHSIRSAYNAVASLAHLLARFTGRPVWSHIARFGVAAATISTTRGPADQ